MAEKALSETMAAFLKCSVCGGPFAPRRASQVTCGAVCGEAHRSAMRRVQKQRRREAAKAGGPAPDARLMTPGELAARLAALTTRQSLDDWHREAARCWVAAPDPAIPAMMRAARERMQGL